MFRTQTRFQEHDKGKAPIASALEYTQTETTLKINQKQDCKLQTQVDHKAMSCQFD